MKIYPMLLVPVFRNTFALPPDAGSHNLNRDFGGLFGGGDDPLMPVPHITYPDSKPTHDQKVSHVSNDGLAGLLAGIETTTSVSAPTSPPTSASSQTTAVLQVISAPLISTANETTNSAATATETQSSTASQSSSESRTWKIVGVSVITITFVVGSIFVVVFFDQWWRFLRDTIVGKSKGPDFEDLVPDWEKRTWEVRLAEEESHRYPSTSTLSANALARQPSARSQNDDPRHPFPARLYPHAIANGVGLGLSAGECHPQH
jgi:hypothetical protein